MLNPGLEVPDDVLVVEAAQVRDLSPDSLVFLAVVLGQLDFLNCVLVPVQFVSCFVHYSESTATDFFQLLEVVSIPRDLVRRIKYSLIISND